MTERFHESGAREHPIRETLGVTFRVQLRQMSAPCAHLLGSDHRERAILTSCGSTIWVKGRALVGYGRFQLRAVAQAGSRELL